MESDLRQLKTGYYLTRSERRIRVFFDGNCGIEKLRMKTITRYAQNSAYNLLVLANSGTQ